MRRAGDAVLLVHGLVAGTTIHRGCAVIVRAADDVHLVPVAVVALAREIAGGVAIDTARVTENGGDLAEGFDRAGAVDGGFCGRGGIFRSVADEDDGGGKGASADEETRARRVAT
jgi:hypothetical protein